MGFPSLGTIAQTAANALPIATQAVANRRNVTFANAEREKQDAIQQLLLQRQARDDDLKQRLGAAQIGHLNSQAEGTWGNPIAVSDEQGNPMMVQQHKITGELRRAVLPSAGGTAAPPSAANAAPSAAGIDGVSADDAEQAPTQAPTQTPGLPPKQAGLKPFVKPLPPQKIDPNSPQGITAAGQKAGAVAAAVAPFKPTKPAASEPLVQVQQPDGSVVYAPRSQAAGQAAPAKAGAGGGAKGSQQAALAGDIEQAIPIMTQLAPKVNGAKVSIAMTHPMTGNLLLNDDEKSYVTAARTFLAGVLHLESGARLSKEQWEIGVTRYLPLPGDPPSVVQQKLNAARETARQRVPAPTNTPHAVTPDPGGNIDLGTPKPPAPKAHVPSYEEWKKSQGIP